MEFTKVEYIKKQQTEYVDLSVFECGEIYHITNRDIDVNLLCVCFDVQDDYVKFIIIDELINALSLAGGYKGQYFTLNNDIDFVYDIKHIELHSLVNEFRGTTEYTMIVGSRKSF
jgi:recombinational DNA repair protein RecR